VKTLKDVSFAILILTCLACSYSPQVTERDRLSTEDYTRLFAEKDTVLTVRLPDASKNYEVSLELHPCYPVENSLLGIRCLGFARIDLFRTGRHQPFQSVSGIVDLSGLHATDSTFTHLFIDETMSHDFLRFFDLNGDRHDDMIVANHDIGFSVYLYNKNEGMLVYDSAVSGVLQIAASYEFDSKKRILTVIDFDNLSVYSDYRKYVVKDEPVLVNDAHHRYASNEDLLPLNGEPRAPWSDSFGMEVEGDQYVVHERGTPDYNSYHAFEFINGKLEVVAFYSEKSYHGYTWFNSVTRNGARWNRSYSRRLTQ
jgi:hypothetical protein